MRLRRFVTAPLILWLVLLGVPRFTAARQGASDSTKKVEERRRAADAAPLFVAPVADREGVGTPLALTLRTDIKLLRDNRPDEDEVEGVLRFTGAEGDTVSVPVKVRTRGDFRREKANCNFPPLRLNFASRDVAGTVFQGQDKLKLVTPCQDSREEYQQYILQEYLVYRVYQLLTPASFRVRLLHITYEDVNGAYEERTKSAFLIEDEDAMAARNRAEVWEWERFDPTGPDDEGAALRVLTATDPQESVMTALFEFMIGNTDFSTPFLHNAVLIGKNDGRAVWVPYDFDWSGVVEARYATPDPRLPIRSVRDRLYRGFCRPGIDLREVAQRFERIRDSIPPLYRGLEELETRRRDRALEYYDQFYAVLSDPRRFERQVVSACRQLR